jgi:hypothetical protein
VCPDQPSSVSVCALMELGIEEMRTCQANRELGYERMVPRLEEWCSDELGWRPRPAVTTIVETAESLSDLGLLEKR